MTDPIWMSVATALATKAASGLYDLVKQRFSKHPERAKALESATGAAADSAEVGELAEALAATEREEPGFGEQLRVALTRVDTQINNVVSGTMNGGAVFQVAGDISGDIRMG